MARPKKTTTGKSESEPDLDRLKLKAFIDGINTKHNKTSLMLADAGEEREAIGRISTGHYAIDEILGGGIPRGRVTEIFGSESAGKSSLALHIVREAQKRGLRVAYVDVEQAIDPDYCEKIGVKWDDIVFSQPDSAEEALDIVDAATRSGLFGLVVLDSVAALVTKRELEGEVGDATMAEVARLMSQQLKKQISPAKKMDCAILYLNQIRAGGMGGGRATNVTSGGRALKFYASVRIELSSWEPIKTGEIISGQKVVVKTKKNKTAPPHRQVTVDLLYPVSIGGVEQSAGYDDLGSIVDAAVEAKVMSKGGAWYGYLEHKFQGRQAARAFVKEHPEIRQAVLG